MCRLYGLHANEPTRIECSLVHAQNALMAQSVKDREGLTHGHGWGVASYKGVLPKVERQAWAAYHGEQFQKSAKRVYAETVVAHVRRATVGGPGIENTHPFTHGRWLFAHNGTIPNFQKLRPRFLDHIDEVNHNAIDGTTDSEHIFHYLLSLWARHPERNLREILKDGIGQIVRWCEDIDPSKPVGLNVVWTDGEHLIGSRLNRTMWFLEREGIFRCDICGEPHVHHDPKRAYRAVEVASEPITNEKWLGVPNGSVFSVDPDVRIHIEPLEIRSSAA